MQTLHIKANQSEIAKILSTINSPAQKGEEIELPDNKTFTYEKKEIDRALKDVEEGKLYTIDEVERELLNAS